MKQAIEDVKAFHVATGTPIAEKPGWPLWDRIWLREDLIDEERFEFSDAAQKRDLTAAADALADIIYVCIGTALEFGIPLAEVWDEVHRSNMAKVDPATGKVVRRADGKILKPKGWTPPDVAGVLARAR